MEKRSNKHPVLRGVKLAIVLIGLFMLGITLYVRFIPDIETVDDSSMRIIQTEVPEEQNGYLILIQAGQRREKFKELEGLKDLRDLSPSVAAKVKSKYKERFEIMDRAISLPHTLDPDIASLSYDSPIPPFLSIRQLAKMRVALAWLDFQSGKRQEALNEILKVLQVGQLMENSEGTLICYLVGNAIKRDALQMLYYMFSETDIPEETIYEWIQNLKDFRENTKSWGISFKGEYRLADILIKNPAEIDKFTVIDGKRTSHWFLRNSFIRSFIFKPNKTRKSFLDYYTLIIESAGKYYNEMNLVEPSFFALNTQWALVKSFLRGNLVGEIMMAITIPNFSTVLERRCYTDFLIESSRLRLALLAYKLKNGNTPETLKKLVPEYLTEIPADPFDGKPIRYNQEKNILYSVGKNIIDDGGDSKYFVFIDLKSSNWIDEKDFVMKIEPK